MADTLIREFRYPQDYPAARALWAVAGPGIQLGRSDEPSEIEKMLLRAPDLFLVAERDGNLVGTVIAGFDGRRGMIYHLAVEAACRAMGIGAALMEEVERRLHARGCLRCHLLVTADNLKAMQFYERRGWFRRDSLHIYSKDLG